MNNSYKLIFNKNKKYYLFRKILALTLLIFPFNTQSISASTIYEGKSSGISFKVDEIARGLGIPWGMTFISPTEILFTERKGSIGFINLENGKIKRIQGGPKVYASGQGGLLDIAVPNDYKPGDWIFLTYSKKWKKNKLQLSTTLARAKLDGYNLIEFSDLLITKPASSSSIHFGSRIAFDGKGNIFFSVGDRGNRLDAQNLSTHSGSILRLRINGKVPENNPFFNKIGALPEIWSFGHRNPQGIFYDTKLKRLWSIEHGPRGGDEINLILPGLNFGWPIISYGKEYWGPIQVGEGTEKKGMEQPIKFYVPSIAPGSIIVYSGKAFPAWKDNLIAGSLKLTHINRIEIDNSGKAVSEERLLSSLHERIRAILESPEGWIYFSTDSGKIMRLMPFENSN